MKNPNLKNLPLFIVHANDFETCFIHYKNHLQLCPVCLSEHNNRLHCDTGGQMLDELITKENLLHALTQNLMQYKF